MPIPPSPTVPSANVIFDNWSENAFSVSDAVQLWQIPGPHTQSIVNTTTAQAAENATKLLQDICKYPALKLDKVRSNTFEKGKKPLDNPFNWIMPHAMIGVEVEVENIKEQVKVQAYWQSKADNSLRNHGVEFVSIPLATKQIELAMNHLYTELRRYNTPDFSNRTSIHIHLNCRDLTQDQIYVLVLLYCIFEKHFYKFAGTKRLNSIFCVPIFRSNLDGKISRLIYNLDPCWNKYCGLNLLPLTNNSLNPGGYGTIEFRHLYGTNDHVTVMHWINNILALRKAAMNISKDELLALIMEMNTTSAYRSLYAQIFPKEYQILENKIDFEDCVSNIKRELFGDDYRAQMKLSNSAIYWHVAAKLGVKG